MVRQPLSTSSSRSRGYRALGGEDLSRRNLGKDESGAQATKTVSQRASSGSRANRRRQSDLIWPRGQAQVARVLWFVKLAGVHLRGRLAAVACSRVARCTLR